MITNKKGFSKGSIESTFYLICLAILNNGTVILKTPSQEGIITKFIGILRDLGVKIEILEDKIVIESQGSGMLFEPKKEIDVQGEEMILYALCGLFANYDYTVFFIDSANLLAKRNFADLILGFYEAGVRFSYNKNFSLPFSMKGTSNFLPTTHVLNIPNKLLNLSLFLSGIYGYGSTKIISKYNTSNNLENLFQSLKGDIKQIFHENTSKETYIKGFKANSLEQNFEMEIKKDAKQVMLGFFDSFASNEIFKETEVNLDFAEIFILQKLGAEISKKDDFSYDISFNPSNKPLKIQITTPTELAFILEYFIAFCLILPFLEKAEILHLDEFFFDDKFDTFNKLKSMYEKSDVNFEFGEFNKSLIVKGFNFKETNKLLKIIKEEIYDL
jgi:5-enolpyruvylshikimate-3-phosphate synthase